LYRPDHAFHVPAVSDEGRCGAIEVTQESLFQACYRLAVEHKIENIAALNFASPTKPGGGFLNGAQAQEEMIARSSGLYPCIVQFHEMYAFGREACGPLASDYIIYSPTVPYFRADDGTLCEHPFCVSIITAAAVNAGACATLEEKNSVRETMKARLRKIMLVAIEHGARALVLGAFGCGVFKNDPTAIATIQGELWVNEGLGQHFDLVVNPVFCTSGRTYTYDRFRAVLCGE
jgi:uncharacterized protein (TIGR02452 family)